MSNLVSLDNSFQIGVLSDFLDTLFQKFELKSKIPLELSCMICIHTRNCKKSKPFSSVNSLICHINQSHRCEPKLHCGEKEEYIRFLNCLSVILDILHKSVGDNYQILLKTFQEMVQRRWIK